MKEETSQNFSIGLTAKIPNSNLKITLDAYQIDIQDRIIFTGQFQPGDDEELKSIFEQAGADRAAFFSNAIDTRSRGIDFVIAHSHSFKKGVIIRNDFAVTFSETKWDQTAGEFGDGIKASPILREKGLVDTYFDQTSRIYLEQAIPRIKFILSSNLIVNKFNVYLRFTYFGETTEATNADIFDKDLNLIDNTIDPYYSGKVVTDLSLGYQVLPNLSLTVGANNLLDTYPDLADETFTSSGRFVYSRRSPQYSLGGRYLFARIVFALK